MIHHPSCRLALAALLLLGGTRATLAQAIALPRTFTAQGNQFLLDGKPFQIISGAIHYTRIPRAYWRDRLRKARAMGLNTVETYAFWNVSEPAPGRFDFSGQNDIAEFIREAQQEGLYVILRPGPYVCAEWEFGGFPSWLLADPRMALRTPYPGFMEAARSYLDRLGEETAPLQIGNGGPILAVQVENEYGSYGADHAYMEQMHQALVAAGFTRSLLYTADGADVLANGTLPDLPAGINFGAGDAERSFAALDKFRHVGIRFNSEWWDGWFDHWGAKHQTRDAGVQTSELRWMLERGYSVNLYMFDGGTSFGWMNGANSNGTNYEPDVTSYDYDVPVAESGELRPKYYAFRDVIASVTHRQPPAPPAPLPSMALAPIPLAQTASLWSNLPAPVRSDAPLTMEQLGQSYGYILYRTHLSAANGTLELGRVHDYAQVYLDGQLAGTVDRRLKQTGLTLAVAKAGAQLDILVENTGRVNYGKHIDGERTGLLDTPTLAGTRLTGWETFALPMLAPGTLSYKSEPCAGPCFYGAHFDVATPADTFLDTSQLVKGLVWINGRPLGRFWKTGPQQTLYLPGPWLKAGDNEIVIFDLDGAQGRTVSGKEHPVLDGPVK